MTILTQKQAKSKLKMVSIIVMSAITMFAYRSECGAQSLPRAIVLDFTSASRDIHTATVSTASDAIAVEMNAQKYAQPISRKELDKAGKDLGLRAPFGASDFPKLCRELDAKWVVTGRVEYVTLKKEDGNRGVEIGIIVKIIDPETGDAVNGSATKAFSPEAADGSETQGLIELKCLTAAARRAVLQINSYSLIEGTILSSPSNGPLVLNRGSGSGVKRNQEFNIIRKGVQVGKARAKKVSQSYTDLLVIENISGIQAQDHAIAIFPEPKFP